MENLDEFLEAPYHIRQIDTTTIKIEGIELIDFPQFTDAFISYAKWDDGEELSDEDKEDHDHIVNKIIHDNQLYKR